MSIVYSDFKRYIKKVVNIDLFPQINLWLSQRERKFCVFDILTKRLALLTRCDNNLFNRGKELYVIDFIFTDCKGDLEIYNDIIKNIVNIDIVILSEGSMGSNLIKYGFGCNGLLNGYFIYKYPRQYKNF